MYGIIIVGVVSIPLILLIYCFYSFVKMIKSIIPRFLTGGLPAIIGIVFYKMAMNTPMLPWNRNHADVPITPEAVHLNNLSYLYFILAIGLISLGVITLLSLGFNYFFTEPTDS